MYIIVEEDADPGVNLTLCCLCNSLMRDPIWLPCSDAFCKSCLDKHDSCPTCGKAIGKSSEGGGEYKTFLSKLVEVTNVIDTWARAKYECEIEIICKNLVPRPRAKHYCMKCHQKMCDECQRAHQGFGGYSKHYVFQPAETKSPADVFQAIKERSQEPIDDKWQKQQQQGITETLKHLEETTEKDKAAVEDKKTVVIEKIKEIEDKVTSWLNEWKSRSLSLRARKRWAALARELIAKGSNEERLKNFTPLSDKLESLKEPASDMPTRSCDQVFRKLSETADSIIETVEVANRADAATDFGMCTRINHMHISDSCINLHLYYILCF